MATTSAVPGRSNEAFLRFMYGAMAAMSMFITAFDKNDRTRDSFLTKSVDDIEVFDFIIVGGGTSGSILANRLSKKYKVLLLEAGGEPFPLQSIPSLAPYMLNHTEIDWAFKTTSQKHACKALKKHRSSICQGKGIGGSSNMGWLNHLRGSPFDYENWANLTGDPGWKYSSLLPYFRRQEEYDGIWKDPITHGFEGEMHMETPNYTGMADRFIQAGVQMNYRMTDLNGLFTEGFDYILSPLRRGYRQGTSSAYINRIVPRSKLTIRKFSTVRRILFKKDDKSLEAYGVVYERNGRVPMALGMKEIIISAGAVNSPKLLMLSGIGPKAHLESLKIKVLKDLPVGRNLQDHLVTYLGPFMLNSSASFLMDRDLTPESVAKFGMIGGQGPLASTGIHANALITSSQQKFSGNIFWPDLHLTLYGMSHHDSMDKEFSEMYNMHPDIATNYFKNTKGQDSFSIIISAGRPFSRGRVRLPNSEPDTVPLINPKYLSDSRDLDAMIDGIYRAISLVENTQAFQEIGATLSPQHFPGCESFEFRSQAYWQCYIRRFSMSANHLTSTCSMGSSSSNEQANSVVDSELKVMGVNRLRVIDASVIPYITVGGTLGPTMVIAEKAADMILNLWEARDKLNVQES